MQALSAICRRRLGFDPATLSPAELQQRLPSIFSALIDEMRATAGQLAVVQKSAELVGRQTPNPGIVRDERVSVSPDDSFSPDPNAVFDSLIP